jgi:hypothetical protein
MSLVYAFHPLKTPTGGPVTYVTSRLRARRKCPRTVPGMRARRHHRTCRIVRRVYPEPVAGARGKPAASQATPRSAVSARRGASFGARFLGNLAGRFVYEWLKDVLGGFLSF